MRGAQLSSILNISDGNIKGVQISLVYNSSQLMTGVQIGIVNKASIVNGTQIGLINIADEIEGGVPIGLINIIGNGQFHGCTWYDGNNIFTFGLKTGTKYFYSLLSLGFTTNKEEMSFYPGIGLGVEIPINRMFIDLDLSLKGFIELEKENDTFEYDKNVFYFNRLSELNWVVGLWGVGKKPLPRLIFQYSEIGTIECLDELISMVQQKENVLVKGVFCNMYRNGLDYLPYHSDNYNCDVISLSFGQGRDFYFKHNRTGERTQFLLENGDYIRFPDILNSTHKHGIPIRKNIKESRINITLFVRDR